MQQSLANLNGSTQQVDGGGATLLSQQDNLIGY